jgi:hypothetical protein
VEIFQRHLLYIAYYSDYHGIVSGKGKKWYNKKGSDTHSHWYHPTPSISFYLLKQHPLRVILRNK